MVIELVGHEAYFRGRRRCHRSAHQLDARHLPPPPANGSRSCRADSVYESTAAALTRSVSVMSELALSPPISGERTAIDGGRSVVEISGAWVGEGITAKDHATG